MVNNTGIVEYDIVVDLEQVRHVGEVMITIFGRHAQEIKRYFNSYITSANDGRKRSIVWITSPTKPQRVRVDSPVISTNAVYRYRVLIGLNDWQQALPGEFVIQHAINKTPFPINEQLVLYKPRGVEGDVLPDDQRDDNDIYYFKKVEGGWERVGTVEIYGPPTYEEYWRKITPLVETSKDREAEPLDIEIDS